MTKRFNKIFEDYTEQIGFSNVLDRILPSKNNSYESIKEGDKVHIELYNSLESIKGDKTNNAMDGIISKITNKEITVNIYVTYNNTFNVTNITNRQEDIDNPYYTKDMDKQLSILQKIYLDADNKGFEDQANTVVIKKENITNISPIDFAIGKWFILVKDIDNKDLHEPIEDKKVNDVKLTEPEKLVKDNDRANTETLGFEKDKSLESNNSKFKPADMSKSDLGKIDNKKVEIKSKGLEKSKRKHNISVKNLLTKIKGVKN